MTRSEFIEKHRHQISGSVLDLLFSEAKGSELSMRVRKMLRDVDAALGAAFDELSRQQPHTNGAPKKEPAK